MMKLKVILIAIFNDDNWTDGRLSNTVLSHFYIKKHCYHQSFLTSLMLSRGK